jgi:hypothetical protein
MAYVLLGARSQQKRGAAVLLDSKLAASWGLAITPNYCSRTANIQRFF